MLPPASESACSTMVPFRMGYPGPTADEQGAIGGKGHLAGVAHRVGDDADLETVGQFQFAEVRPAAGVTQQQGPEQHGNQRTHTVHILAPPAEGNPWFPAFRMP